MSWKKIIRETGLIEYVCHHGVGHPDYSSAEKIAKKYDHDTETWLVHGCCGCCNKKDFPGKEKVKK